MAGGAAGCGCAAGGMALCSAGIGWPACDSSSGRRAAACGARGAVGEHLPQRGIALAESAQQCVRLLQCVVDQRPRLFRGLRAAHVGFVLGLLDQLDAVTQQLFRAFGVSAASCRASARIRCASCSAVSISHCTVAEACEASGCGVSGASV